MPLKACNMCSPHCNVEQCYKRYMYSVLKMAGVSSLMRQQCSGLLLLNALLGQKN